MNIKDLIGEATEYDKKLALEERKPKMEILKHMSVLEMRA